MAFLPELPAQAPAYAELMCQSAFSFGVGASQPEELVARAHALGYSALALTDECSVAGVVRAHTQAQALGLQLLPGALFQVPLRGPGPGVAHPARFTLVALPVDAPTWAALCGFVTQARSASPKGQYRVRWPDPAWAQLRHCQVLLVLPADMDSGAVSALLTRARAYFDADFWVAASHHALAGDEAHIQRLQGLAAAHGVRGVAVGAVRMHLRSRKPLQDVLTAVRLHRPLAACGLALQANAQAHLRQRRALGALYPPAWLAATLEVARRCTFSLEQLRYHYPLEAVLPGQTPAQTLHQHTWAGAQQRYPQGVPAAVAQQLGHELGLIAELKFEMYFLTVHDLVAFARGQGILCQGRGSAANSAVCYCLGITEVDPARSSLLFERFISRERREPPDIDVDFEHQRREEVIQYIYTKYGRAAPCVMWAGCYKFQSA
jgi:error-prone DNA polymerase